MCLNYSKCVSNIYNMCVHYKCDMCAKYVRGVTTKICKKIKCMNVFPF